MGRGNRGEGGGRRGAAGGEGGRAGERVAVEEGIPRGAPLDDRDRKLESRYDKSE